MSPSRRVPASEDGIALPIVLTVVIVGFALASMGALAAIGSIRNAGRDGSDKSALAVAEAGAQQALYRQNKILTTPHTSAFRCLTESGGRLLASQANADGWCEMQSGSVGGGTYRYRVRPDFINSMDQRQIAVVSEGTLNGEVRRVYYDMVASTGEPAFGTGQVIGLNLFNVASGTITGNMQTNSDLVLQGSASVCGEIIVGTGKSVLKGTSASICPGYSVNQATTTLGPVDMADVRTNNSNARILNGQDVFQNANNNQINSIRNAFSSTKRLSLGSQQTLTLGGGNYFMCQISLGGGSQLIIANPAQVRIYFGTPEECNIGTSNSGCPSQASNNQIDTQGNSKVVVTSGDPNDLAFLFAGSATNPYASCISLGGTSNFTNQMTVYAPRSSVNIQGNSTYRGPIAGLRLSIQGNPRIIGTPSSLTFQTDVELNYRSSRFLECTGPLPEATSPDTGC